MSSGRLRWQASRARRLWMTFLGLYPHGPPVPWWCSRNGLIPAPLIQYINEEWSPHDVWMRNV